MPYRRRRKAYKRPYRGRARDTSRMGVYGAAGAQLWRDVKWLKSMINVEKKYLDNSGAGTGSSTTPTFALLNGCGVGTSATVRTGVSIKMTSLLFNIYGTINAAATETVERIIILLDTQPNAAAPTAANVLQASTVVAPMNIDYGSRFKILRDMRFTMSINGNEIFRHKVFLKLDHHVKFNTSTTGTVSDITEGSLYMLHLSNEATNTPLITWYSRVRFIDN